MKYQVLAVHDSALGQYLVPMHFQSVGQAIRSFTDEVNRSAKDNMMFQHPEHFKLFQLGVYDADSGLYETRPPHFLVSAQEVVDNASTSV